MAENDVDNELLDYEEDEEPQGVQEATQAAKKEVKGSYVSIHSSGFRDFLLKPELLRAIVDCGFEHPSEGKGQPVLVSGRLCCSAVMYRGEGPQEVGRGVARHLMEEGGAVKVDWFTLI